MERHEFAINRLKESSLLFSTYLEHAVRENRLSKEEQEELQEEIDNIRNSIEVLEEDNK